MRFLIFRDEFWSGLRFLHRYIEAESLEKAAEKLKCKILPDKKLRFSEGSREIELRLIQTDEIQKAEEFFLDGVLRRAYSDGGH